MGFLDDIKKAAGDAGAAGRQIVVEPGQRLDMIVTDADGGAQLRRSDYSGTAWFGGRQQLTDGRPVPGPSSEINASFWLPDSHAYSAAGAAQAQVQASVSLQSAMASSYGGAFCVLDAGAALGDDPQGGGALRVYVSVTAYANMSLGVAYRVTVLAPV